MSAATAIALEPDLTWEEAQAMLRRSEDRFQRGAVDELLSRYAEDIVIRYADLPEIRGREAAARFMRARFLKQKNYRLKKVLFSVSGQKIANTWTGEWEDAETGRQMAGSGVEILELRGGQVIRWEAAFNVWQAGNQAASRYFLPG
jgi:nuclear transport factor 2 (NTF2) superfamily protein